MGNSEILMLAMTLLKADSEEEVISILEEAGYWNNPNVWRLIGDREGNYSTIGNQQSRPEAALTEKLINSIDARLMSECMVSGIHPESEKAPQSIREAVARFFESKANWMEIGGTIRDWDDKRRHQISEGITIAVTGDKRRPCVTITDMGEGQQPDMIHETFLSIDRTNKLKIPFVQGKYNMGGTGVLRFCGKENLQLIITKRNPSVVKTMKEMGASSDCWSFTVIRRESPPAALKNSIYTYLSPVMSDGNHRKGDVLTFRSNSLPIFPDGNKPYVRECEWGSGIKMYNYDMKGFASHACMKSGLLYRLGIMLPEPALPIRIYECREYRGHAGSFSTTLTGLTVRLEDNKAENLEGNFPDSVPFKVRGQEMIARIYAFKKDKAETYRVNEGVIFTINGQTHGAIPKTIFSRKNVKMGRLANSLLIIVDCSNISYRSREILFMNSRDRLGGGDFRKELEEELERIIHDHHGLRELRERRKSQEIADRLDDAKPLEEILNDILKSSPSLSALFLSGSRLARPFKQRRHGENGNQGDGGKEGEKEFCGNLHPSFFRFKKKKYGQLLRRDCEIGRRCRIAFETDVQNDYFKRAANAGRFMIEVLEGDWQEEDFNWNLTLHNGLANASITVPDDSVIGDEITLQFTVEDDVIPDPFVNVAKLHLKPQGEKPGGGNNKEKRGGEGGREELQKSGIKLPKIHRIREENWDSDFDRYTACKVVQDEDEEDESQDVYEFYVNIDNLYLKTDMKMSKEDPKLIEDKFVYGNALVGLALIRHYREQEKEHRLEQGNGDESGRIWGREFTVEEYVEQTTKALAPFVLPMINNLGALTSELILEGGQIGDDE